MPKRDSHHVVPDGDRWAVRRSGSDRASVTADTQREAIEQGREISRNQGTEFVIHRPNGQIRDSDSHGSDPFPPRG